MAVTPDDDEDSDETRPEDLSALPERTCIVTRVKGEPGDLVRFVVDPQGVVVPDIRARLPGRGVWVTASRERVSEAVRRRLFARAFRKPVATPEELPATVATLLRRDALQFLSLANKAGALVTGFGKVSDAAGSPALAALVHAADAADDGVRKIAQALRRARGDRADAVPVIRGFSSDELGLALGGALVIHAALVAGPGSGGFLSSYARLARYDGGAAGHGAVAGSLDRETRDDGSGSAAPTRGGVDHRPA